MPKNRKDKLPASARKMRADPAMRRLGSEMEQLKKRRLERIQKLKREEAERQLRKKR